LDSLNELTSKEKHKIKKHLTHIRDDSIEHKNMIEKLIGMVIENGENTY